MQLEERKTNIVQGVFGAMTSKSLSATTAGIAKSMFANALSVNKMTTRETTPQSNIVIPTILLSDDEMTETNATITMETTSLMQSNTVVPIILLSDDESTEANAIVTLPKASKKRRSLDAADGEHRSRRRKLRKIKADGAPKMPLTGYVRFMNHRRESLRKEHPNISAIEHTKMIGEEWNNLSEDQRDPFMQAAKADKIRYTTELSTFLKENPDVVASEIAKNKARKSHNDADWAGTVKGVLKDKSQQLNRNAGDTKPKELLSKTKATRASRSSNSDKDTSPPPVQHKRTLTSKESNLENTATTAAPLPGTIPIFTNDFLQQNKHFDNNLRALRKSRSDLEQKTALLEKHVDNLKTGVNNLETENNELEEKTRLLKIYTNKLMFKLVNAFSTLPLPTEPNGATMENIFKYMNDLSVMTASSTHGSASLSKAKDIIRELDIHIQL